MGKRIALSAWNGIAFVLLMLSAIVTIVSFCLRYVVLNEATYHDIPKSPGFVEKMTEYVLADLENECDVYAGKEAGEALYEHLKQAVTSEWVASLSQKYAESMYASLMSGESPQVIDVDPTEYQRAIEAFFMTLPAEERPEDTVATARTMATELADSTATTVQSGLVSKVLPQAHRYLYGNPTVHTLASLFWWCVGASVLLALLNLIWLGSTLRNRAYAVAGALFLGSAVLFVPLWLIQRHDLTERLVLGNSPLKLYVSGLVNSVVDGIATVTMWAAIISFILLLLSVVWAVWPPQKLKEGKKTMKILCIGNSFSMDATRYLEQMADGELMVRNCYIGGCSLKMHCSNIAADAAAYEYQKDAVAVSEEHVALSDALTREAWDWVTVQQVSHQSGQLGTYEPYLTELLAYVKKLCPQAKIAFHRTWAYETGSNHPGFVNYGNDREAMFDAILSAGGQAAEAHGLPTIPSGDAVQCAGRLPEFDAAQGGQSLYRDGFHMHLIYGRYLTGLCWYRFFTGKSATTVTCVPDGADVDKLNKLKEIVG